MLPLMSPNPFLLLPYFSPTQIGKLTRQNGQNPLNMDEMRNMLATSLDGQTFHPLTDMPPPHPDVVTHAYTEYVSKNEYKGELSVFVCGYSSFWCAFGYLRGAAKICFFNRICPFIQQGRSLSSFLPPSLPSSLLFHPQHQT